MLPKPLKDLQKHFQSFPGVGPRQASRFAFFLTKQPKEYTNNLVQSIQALENDVSLCDNCNMPKEKSKNNCTICLDEKRNKNIIYIVEKEPDALNLEKANIHSGVYFVLGQNISPIDKNKYPKENIKNLIRKLKKEKSAEVILALNNTREGNFTSMYIKEMFKENELNNIKLTKLGRGLSTGSELEYADEETLKSALENKK